MIKRMLTCVVACSIAVSAHVFPLQSALAAQNDQDVQVFDKITPQLAAQIDAEPDADFPVVLWLKEVSFDEIENDIKSEIGYNLYDLEIEYPEPSEDLINELAKAADGTPDDYLKFLMEKHLGLTESARTVEKERTDLYRKTRLNVLKDLNSSATLNMLERSGVSEEKIGFISSLAPMVVCKMTADEIQAICSLSEIQEVDYYTPIEAIDCAINMGTTKATVGIDKINNILGLTGDGVKLGIYETCTVSSQYYSSYGIDSSHVSIVGPAYNTGSTHSTYCAGVAAGSNGVAPSAHIKSATCEYDWQSFDWSNYDNAQLSNFEALIADGVDIVSISWGSTNGSACYNYWTKYTDYLIADTATTVVCATGNDSSSYIISPSSAYNCIAVNGFIDTYNNQAQELVNDYSYNNGNGCLKPDVLGPSLNNGTSTATPYIAGMIALMYQYKPSLAARPELTKAILLSSCHRKCDKLLSGSTVVDLSETMWQGITDRQGAGIPDMYRMISIVSQHTYGNGVLSSNNNYEREVNFIQPAYNSSNINVSMAYLQTNVPSDSTSGVKDDYDITITNNNSTSYSSRSNSSTEMIYKPLTSSTNYKLRIYKYSGESESIRYGYAWSTDKERYFNNYGEEGVYLLKNYKSGLYLSRDTSTNQAFQTTYASSMNNVWILDSLNLNSSSYSLKNSNIISSGLGIGSSISSTNYYALEGSNATVNAITVTYDSTTGTYTFKQTINGSTYALGINGQSTSSGAYANWSPYSSSNASQKWYIEAGNYRSGDTDCNGIMQENDRTLVLQYIVHTVSLTNNLQVYLADVNKDNVINISDTVLIAQIVADS